MVNTYSSQPPSDSPRLLWPQVKRKVLLFLVELPKVLTRLLVGHGQHPSDRLSNSIAITNAKQSAFLPFQACLEGEGGRNEHLGQFCSRSTGDFLYTQSQKIMLELGQLLGQIVLGPAQRMRISQKGHLDEQMRTLTGVRRP